MAYTIWQETLQNGLPQLMKDDAVAFIHDKQPDFRYDAKEDEPNVMKRKVIRGGSWKDIAYFLQCGTKS